MNELNPTYDLEAEAGLLASLIMDGKYIPKVKGILHPHYFYDSRHYAVYKAICKLSLMSDQIDAILLKDRLEKDSPEHNDWADRICTLVSGAATPANAMRYAHKITECYLKRKTAEGALKLAQAATRGKTTVEDLDKLKREIPNTSDVFRERQSLIDLADEGLAPINTRLERAQNEMSTGLRILNRYTMGLERTWLYVIAGDTSHGKTAIAIQMICANLAKGKKVRYYTYDLSSQQIFLRIACYLAGETTDVVYKPYDLGLQDINERRERVDNFKHVAREIAETYKDSLIIKEYTNLEELEGDCADGADIVVVDYIQTAILKQHTQKYKDMNCQSSWEEYMSRLKEIANLRNCAVLALSQYSRPIDKQQFGKSKARRTLYDMKHSGAIEQKANCILLVEWRWRSDPVKYMKSHYEFQIPKVTNGESSMEWRQIHFDYAKQRFADIECQEKGNADEKRIGTD